MRYPDLDTNMPADVVHWIVRVAFVTVTLITALLAIIGWYFL